MQLAKHCLIWQSVRIFEGKSQWHTRLENRKIGGAENIFHCLYCTYTLQPIVHY